MTANQVEALGPAFTEFLRPFERFFFTTSILSHFRLYTRGLLTDMPRKTIEPLALNGGARVRTLQQFMKVCLWDHLGLTNGVQRHLLDATRKIPAGPLGTIGLLDETSSLKQGKKTPGVQRQYLGSVGKVANGIVTVHLAVAHGSFKALLDSELYLPESWGQDRKRCREADIPDEMHYRPKWMIALELIARAQVNGWQFDWLTFDEGYGSKPGFLTILDAGNQSYIGEVPKSFSVRPGRSRRSISAEAVFSRPAMRDRAARTFRFEQQTGPASVWQTKVVDVCAGEESSLRRRLIWARNRETGEVKYFIARSRRRTNVRRLLAVGFTRWNVEHVFRIMKSEIGLTHFEGRSYVALKRHLALCLVAMAFVALHAMRLRGEKSGGHDGAGVPSPGLGVPTLPDATTGHV